jgi:CPA2 family monovalent cation:H+ antiporter-2
MLDVENIPYIALDLDPDRVAQASAAGQSVVFGDAARAQALIAAGLSRASAVVLTYLDGPGALKVLHTIREQAPNTPVIVRTQDDHDLEKLQRAGATEVVPEAIEGSLMLASHALALVGVPMRRVIRIVQEQRDARYNLLRGYFHGADDSATDDGEQEHLRSITLSQGLDAPLTVWRAKLRDVRVVQVRQSTGRLVRPEDNPVLGSGDTLVLSGTPQALALAEEQLLR